MQVALPPPRIIHLLHYNMKNQLQVEDSPNLYLSVTYAPKPDNRSTRWKSTKSARSQSDAGEVTEEPRMKRRLTSGEGPQGSADLQRLKVEVRSSHADNHSIIFSPQVQHSQYSRGISIIDENQEIYDPIQFSSFAAWLLLIMASISNAIVPCWMTVDVNCEGLTRSAWRIFITCLLLLPFVLYEQRNVKLPGEYFRALLSRENLQRHFIFSLNYSVWVLFGTMALKLTARSHSFSLLRLKFFFISLRKFTRGESFYESEMGGAILVGIGAIMMFWDSYTLPVQHNPLAFYLGYSPLSRICGDLLSVLGSLAILYFQSNYSMPKTPRFSNLFLNNLCLCVNLVAMGYFFGGNQFSFDPVRGVFGLFTRQNFVSIFYVSIMLGLNLIIGNLLVDKIFSPFIRNVASCFEPVITVAIYHFFSIEVLAPGTACLGLAFLVPGMMLIVGGQNYLQKEEIKINFLIYKQEEKHFMDFARRAYQSKIQASKLQQEEQNESFTESEDEAPPDKQKYD